MRTSTGRNETLIRRAESTSNLRRLPGALPAIGLAAAILTLSGTPATAHSAQATRRAQPTSLAHVAVSGGTQTSIQQAPWQTIVTLTPAGQSFFYLCSGEIIDATHVVTAAHCVFDPSVGTVAPTADFLVQAGTSDFRGALAGDDEQDETVTSIRVHPYFDYNAGPGTADDVAVLTLSTPLDLSGSTAKAITLASTSSPSLEGTVASAAAFGRQDPNGPADGLLYSLSTTLQFSRECGDSANALWLCGSSTAGSMCVNDGGGGLTSTAATPTLLGIYSFDASGSSTPCTTDSLGGFVNLTAPEVQDFIDGSDSPPQAPQGGGMSCIGTPQSGDSLTCQPGSWSNNPTFTFTFVDDGSGQVLQSSASPTYQFSQTDVGRSIYAQVEATNAGGIGLGRTTDLPPIAAASTPPHLPPTGVVTPPPPTPTAPVTSTVTSATPSTQSQATVTEPGSVSLVASNIAVRSSGKALVKLSCLGAQRCSGKLTLTTGVVGKGKKHGSHAVTIGSATFSLAGDSTEAVTLPLKALGHALLTAAHGRLSARLSLLQSEPGPAHTQTTPVHLLQQKLTRHGHAKQASSWPAIAFRRSG